MIEADAASIDPRETIATVEDYKPLGIESGSMALYARQTQDDLLATGQLIGGLYAIMADFPTFRALSLLYFGQLLI